MKASLAFLLIATTNGFHSHVLRTYRFPHTAFTTGVHYIHSPEHFLPTHGLVSGPNFCLHRTESPVRLQDNYWLAEFGYRTAWDRGFARVFTNASNTSYFLLSDNKRRPCVMGQMRVRALSRGFTLRCFAQRIRSSGVWETLLGGVVDPSAELVESMVHASGCAVAEDANLREYRRHVMRI